jgi:hypothetical protein
MSPGTASAPTLHTACRMSGMIRKLRTEHEDKAKTPWRSMRLGIGVRCCTNSEERHTLHPRSPKSIDNGQRQVTVGEPRGQLYPEITLGHALASVPCHTSRTPMETHHGSRRQVYAFVVVAEASGRRTLSTDHRAPCTTHCVSRLGLACKGWRFVACAE